MSSIEKAIEKLNRQKGVAEDQQAEFETGAGEIQQPILPRSTTLDSTASSEARSSIAKPKIELYWKKLARAGYLTVDTMQGELAEQYRHVKRPLLSFASGRIDTSLKNANLIAVTSALRGEGKTFTAFNLAMMIAIEQDLSVLLVDGDLIARSLTQLVGLDAAPGLTDVLVKSGVGLSEVIVGTNVPKLNVLPAGRVRRNTTELLASEQMRYVVRELSERYSNRIVLFDTAPILLTSQAMVLDSLVGQALLVVEEGQTPQVAIQDAVEMINKDKAIGLVLNKSRRPSSGGYSYGYY
jgi:receptor protein-tyrosine kinase